MICSALVSGSQDATVAPFTVFLWTPLHPHFLPTCRSMFLSVGDYSCLSKDNQLSWLAQDQGVSSELRRAQSFFVSYLFSAVLGLRCCSQAFLVAASGGCSLAPVASRRGARAPGCRPQWLWYTACLPFGVWDLPDRESNPCPPRWQVGSYPLDHQEVHKMGVVVR